MLSFLLVGTLVSIAVQISSIHSSEKKADLDFRIAANQRISLLKESLEAPKYYLESLRRFYENSIEVDFKEFQNFLQDWSKDEQGLGFASFPYNPSQDGPMLVGTWDGKILLQAEDFARSVPYGEMIRALVIWDAEAKNAYLLFTLGATTESGEKALLAVIELVQSRIGLAIAPMALWGIPSSLIQRFPEERLLYFQRPRLDAQAGKPLLEPEMKPKHSVSMDINIADLDLRLRVDASPKYVEQRKSNLLYFIAPSILSFFILLLVAVLSLLRRSDKAEKESRASSDELKRFFNLNPDLLCICDLKGQFLRVNAEWEKTLKYPLTSLLGRNFMDFVHPDDTESTLEATRQLEEGKTVFNFSNRYLDAEGKYHSFEWCSAAAEGKIYGAARDVSERKAYERSLQQSLEEKEWLLKEVHHRVKNNLQIVSSLLQLQQNQEEDERLSRIVAQAQNRIRSMSLVHEALYHSETLDKIPFAKYVDNLLSVYSFTDSSKSVKIEIAIDPLVFNLDLAINAGLLLNELATNAVKHAFTNSEDPCIYVSLVDCGEGILQLVVEDNGCGLADDFSVSANAHLGLNLVNALCAQLGGNQDDFKASSSAYGGARFEIRIHPKEGSFSRSDATKQDHY
ncbi:hypothetical protein MASR2M78_28230 [Treponema sp.]